MRFWWRVFPLAVGLLLTSQALAQPLDPATEARRTALFVEGRRLHLKGQHAEAIEKLSEVVRLRRSPQALRALGLAEAAGGKLGAASQHLRQALEMATEAKQTAEIKPAQKALEEISPRVPRLRLMLPPAVKDLTVTVDNAVVKIAATNLPAGPKEAPAGAVIEVDAGVHTITVRAPSSGEFTRTVQANEGETTEVRVVLTRSESSLHRPLGIGIAAVGAGGLVLGAVTGILAIEAHAEFKKTCPAGACSSTERAKIDAYHTLGTVSTVGLVAGGVLAAAGALVFFTAPRLGSSATLEVRPFVGLGQLGARGVF